MKSLAGIFLIVVCVVGQETTTEGLLRAQRDLSIAHEFFEMNIIHSRDELSTYVYEDSRVLTLSHMDAYADVKTISLEITSAMNLLPVTPESEDCLIIARRRWEFQIKRYGARLSDCIEVAHQRFIIWNNLLNGIHATGHLTANQVQNQGVSILADSDNFVGNENFPAMINRQLRITLARSMPYFDQFTDFLRSVEEGSTAEVERLIECDRTLVNNFRYDANLDYARARRCLPREE